MYFPVSSKRSENPQILVRATTVLLIISLFVLCHATPTISRSSGPHELIARDVHRYENLHPGLITRNEDDDECEDDCTNIEGYESEELEQEERDERNNQDVEDESWSEVEPPDDLKARKRGLAKRGAPKWINACDGVAVMKQDTGGYPGPKSLVRKRGDSVLFFMFKEKQNCDSFAFGLQTETAKKSVKGLASEHVLEVHLVKDFINSQKQEDFPNPDSETAQQKPKTDLCHAMQPQWQSRPAKQRLTQVNGVTFPQGKQALKWIAQQFPHSPDVFIDELPLLDQDVNTMKERAWSLHQLVDETKAKTAMKTLLASDNYDRDLQKAIKKYKNGLAVKKYQRAKQIQKILLTQTRRIGDVFNSLDVDVLPAAGAWATKKGKVWLAWQKSDLRKKWLDFMEERTDDMIEHTETWLKDWADAFSKRRAQLREELKAEQAKTKPNDRKVQTLKRFIDRIRLLNQEYEVQRKKAWMNPFKFDPDDQMSNDEDE